MLLFKDKYIINKIITRLKNYFGVITFSFTTSWNASKWMVIVRIVIVMFNTLVPFVNIFIGKEIINLFAASLSDGVDNKDCIQRLAVLTVVLLVLQLLGRIMQQVQEYCGNIHMGLISRHISIQIARKSVSLDLSYFDSSKFYDELINARRDSAALQTLTWLVIDIIRGGVQFLVSAVILSKLNFVFTAVLVAVGIPAMIAERKYTARLYNWQRTRAPEERKMDYILGILTGKIFAKDVRLYGFHEDLISRYTTLWKKWFDEKRSISKKKCRLISLLSIAPELAVSCMMLCVGINIFLRKLTIGDYSLYSGIIGQMTSSIYMLINLVAQIYDNDIRLENYKKFLQWESKLSRYGSLKPGFSIKIDFKDVSFRYPDTEEYVLNKLNFSIDNSEKVALVGLNGSGKSTIVKLILRFYDPTEGIILVNGKDAREYEVDELRRCFSVMFQDFANYAFTIREGITLADLKGASDEQRVINACIRSDAQSVVEKHEKGLDTYLTRQFEKDGKELSGGEWQKIALARAFFRDGCMIILDEPSSSLDPEAEYRIFRKFAELCQGKGAIFISHRLSNVTMADRIIVLEEGSIIETGTHEELMRKSGRYAYLFNLQAERYKAG